MSDQRRPPVLITDIINQASSQLREAGIETPEHDAKLLLAEAAGVELRDVDRALLMGEELGTTGQLAVFRAMLDRRAKREPLQYITGHAPFRYLDLKVGPGVFIPRPETETVVQAGLDWLTKNGMIHPCVVEIADATSFATLAQLDGTVDIVITNPPYVPQTDIPEQPEVRDWDPELALYGGSMDGTLIPERIIERACRLLKPGGVLVMEHDVTQGDRLVAFARATGFAAASTGQDWTGRDRYLFAVS